MEILSEHTCQGWLEGYLLTGRHGLFSCYEAFIHIVDSMFNQHAKWLDACSDIPWRRPIASLNYLLSSHVWHQDHNGFSHQDPGFIDVALNKKADIVRVYLPPDANTLLCVTDHVLRTWNRINIIVAGKPPSWQWLSMDEAIVHCRAGVGIWDWASTDERRGAGRGDGLRRRRADAGDAGRRPDPARACSAICKIRVVNVVDLMTLQPKERPSARPVGRGVRRAVHRRQARHLRLSRLSLDDPPADLPPHQPRQHPCARLQRGRHDDDALRHDGAERPRPLPSRAERARLGARAEERAQSASGRRWTASSWSTAPISASTARTCRKSWDGSGSRTDRADGDGGKVPQCRGTATRRCRRARRCRPSAPWRRRPRR